MKIISVTSDFHTNTVISRRAGLPTRQNGVENRDKASARLLVLVKF